MTHHPLRISRRTPLIDEDLWLDVVDLAEIRALVQTMAGQMRQGLRPIRFGSRPRLRGALLIAAGGMPGPRDIRAVARLAEAPDITLSPFPLYDEEIGDLAADLPAFSITVTGVLAHEISHVRQWVEGGDRTRQAHRESQQAQETAQRTRDYADYVAYLETPLETAAHATQLAVEVLLKDGADLRPADFEASARATGLWAHITYHPLSRPETPQAGARAFNPAGTSILENGWWIYRRLTAPE